MEIGFENQILDEDNELHRIWAITWDRRYDGSHLVYGGPPSYTDDGGESWHIIENLADRQIITYNISPHSNGVHVSSNEGLFISENTILWEKIIQDERDDLISSKSYKLGYLLYELSLFLFIGILASDSSFHNSGPITFIILLILLIVSLIKSLFQLYLYRTS